MARTAPRPDSEAATAPPGATAGAPGDTGGADGHGSPPAELRIGDTAARFGVSARTLRYYEELGLLVPSGRTAGGERRYLPDDVALLERILQLKDVLGMNLEEIRDFLGFQSRLDELRQAYRARQGQPSTAARAEQLAILAEALAVNETLADQLAVKLARMEEFRTQLLANARRCRQLLRELED